MRRWQYVVTPLFFLFATIASSEEHVRTDAQIDGFAGRIFSVSTNVTRSGVKWQQPAGPTLVTPIWCWDCEYDFDGTKTKSGQVANGVFLGEIIRLVRDADGQVTERFASDVSTGQILRRDVMGTLGKTEQITFINGKPSWRGTFSYDQYGHRSIWLSADGAGNHESRTLTVTDEEGTVRERSSWGENGELAWQQTFDPETQTEHFTTFDLFGGVKLTWTAVAGRLTSFWEPIDSPSQFGDSFNEVLGDGNADHYECSSDRRCDVSHVHYEYLDPERRNPISAEWRDSEGNLQLAAYCDYEIDSFGNWTHRQVWVWTPELSQRALYETDSRTITYWPQ